MPSPLLSGRTHAGIALARAASTERPAARRRASASGTAPDRGARRLVARRDPWLSGDVPAPRDEARPAPRPVVGPQPPSAFPSLAGAPARGVDHGANRGADHGPAHGGRRWSADAWLLVRNGGPSGTLAGLVPSYGASQYGLVVRRTFGAGPRAPAFAYVRIAGATGHDEAQLAAGLGLRPLPRIPLALLGEARLQRDGQGMALRPALAAVSEVPPARLPFGIEGNVYAQAGWVGGAGATPFFDAQATVERRIPLPLAGVELRLGGGAWAGGQKGATRLDVGPRAALRTAIAGRPVQVAADWRVRVAGDAAPGSGPALTLSTGF
ncbi:hypothetical protein [Novosphingobium huizhouense]|uniref:hypothetical protein n=1 Tax=Novosphingobium huizhouense TaxID=2866625 RepID=UPI001CD8AD16|nr:hypothetical protein [Novosphingobium huizhouense]